RGRRGSGLRPRIRGNDFAAGGRSHIELASEPPLLALLGSASPGSAHYLLPERDRMASGRITMPISRSRVLPRLAIPCAVACALLLAGNAFAAERQATAKDLERKGVPIGDSSYMPVDVDRPFQEVYEEHSPQKEPMKRRQQRLLEARYDLADRPHPE